MPFHLGRAHRCERGRLPARRLVLVDQQSPDPFVEVVSTHDARHYAELGAHAFGKIERRAAPFRRIAVEQALIDAGFTVTATQQRVRGTGVIVSIGTDTLPCGVRSRIGRLPGTKAIEISNRTRLSPANALLAKIRSCIRGGSAPGAAAGTGCAAGGYLYRWLDGNPDVRMLPVSGTNDPALTYQVTSGALANGVSPSASTQRPTRPSVADLPAKWARAAAITPWSPTVGDSNPAVPATASVTDAR